MSAVHQRSRPSTMPAWRALFRSFSANMAVTVAVNNRYGAQGGTATVTTASGSRTLVGPVRTARTGGAPPSLADMRSNLDDLDYRVGDALFGSHFTRLSEARRGAWIGCVENLETNVHAHLLWRIPEDRSAEFAEILPGLWRARLPAGTATVTPVHDLLGWADYCLKDQTSATLDADASHFVTNRPRPNRS